MIKKLLLIMCIALPMCVTAQTLKFATVNTEDVFSAMPEKKVAESLLAEVSKKYEDEFKKLQDDFTQKYTEFQNLDINTPKSIRDRRLQELQENQEKIRSFQDMASQDLQKQQQTLMTPIMDKIKDAVRAIGAEVGYTMIFDMALPSVIYAGPTSTDITSLVKSKLGIPNSPSK